MVQIDQFSESTDYKRDLGLMEAISIVIGRIIGSGIFRTPAPIMALVGCTSLFGLVWIIGGLLTIFSAVIYAELASMMPRSGGPYIYIRTAYGPFWAFLRGWAMFFVSETAAIAAVALVFSEYLDSLFTIFFNQSLGPLTTFFIALSAIWLMTGVNLFGVYFSGKVQNIFAAIKLVALGTIIGIGLTSVKSGNISNFTSPIWPEHFNGSTILAIGAAMRYSLFAFSGWEGATYIAEEIKNPRQNLPASLFLGIACVMVLYLSANVAYLFQLSPDIIAKSKWVATDAMHNAIGATGGILIAVTVALNAFGNINTQIFCKARSWQVMARDGVFFKSFANLHQEYKTPNVALIAQGIWASILLIFSAMAENSYETIIDFFTATSTIFNIMTFYAIYILRKKYPDIERTYKAWLYPYSLIAIITIYLILLYITFITAFIPSVTGIALTLTGTIYYFGKKHNLILKMLGNNWFSGTIR